MPMSLPVFASSSGPPLFPGLIAASVCNTFDIGLPTGLFISRPIPLMIPDVNEWSKPNGCERAMGKMGK
jgi:hypothetical protein